ncbi:MAG: hypothetical protein MK008_09925 [Bdellovibrionales bacterium]|nr:hypothetical protein [Bdellovibrionales bacterium]
MLFTILIFIFNSSFADNYVNSKFYPLTYFGSSDHLSKIEQTQNSINALHTKLSIFYRDFYEYGNTNKNVISSTKFKRPDIYKDSGLALQITLASLKDNLSILVKESELKIRTLELYKLPEISQLPSSEQKLYTEIKNETYKSAQEHFFLIQQLYEKAIKPLMVIEHLFEHQTKVNNKSINHQPLSELRKNEFKTTLSEIQLIKRILLAIEASARDIHHSTELIENSYKKSLAERFGFKSPNSFNEVAYKHVNSFLFEMYKSIKQDVTVNEMASNPFVIKRYLHQLKVIINNLEAILTFSHSIIPSYEHKIFRELRDHLKKKSRLLEREQSLYSIVGFLSRYYNPETDHMFDGGSCKTMFQ